MGFPDSLGKKTNPIVKDLPPNYVIVTLGSLGHTVQLPQCDKVYAGGPDGAPRNAAAGNEESN